MRRILSSLVVVGVVAAAAPARAQAPQWVNDVLAAAQLPVATLQARTDGMTQGEVQSLLDVLRSSQVPAQEAVVIVDSTRVARREYGPVNNFGAFVQSQLAAGKRGRDLAAAIRAEHARMGKGKGNMKGAPGANGMKVQEDVERGRGNASPGDRGKGRGNDDANEAKGRGERDDAPNAKRPQNPGRPATPPANRGKGRPPLR